MAVSYPTDYPFNVDSEGWPESVYTPAYPFEHYYDNGRNPDEITPKIDQTPQYTSKFNNDRYQPNVNFALPLAIRRHTPGSTDPNLQQSPPPPPPPPPPPRSPSPTLNARFAVKRNRSQPKPSSAFIGNHSRTSLDPDERPIKPMKDTSVYKKPSIQEKTIQPKKPSSPPPKSKQSSPRSEVDSFQPPSSRTRMNNISPRRPIRTDLIPKTPFGIPLQHNRSRHVVVEEYDDDDYDDGYPAPYVKPILKKIVSYKKVSGMTTREMENYQMSKARRIVRVRLPPTETIIYQV